MRLSRHDVFVSEDHLVALRFIILRRYFFSRRTTLLLETAQHSWQNAYLCSAYSVSTCSNSINVVG